jgi:hypothetical protein
MGLQDVMVDTHNKKRNFGRSYHVPVVTRIVFDNRVRELSNSFTAGCDQNESSQHYTLIPVGFNHK